MTSPPDENPPIPGMEQFEWPLGLGHVGQAFDQLGDHCKKILILACSNTRWTPADRLSVIAALHKRPAREREGTTRRMLKAFNPEPPKEHAAIYVSLTDLEPQLFMHTYERFQGSQPAPAPPVQPPATPSSTPIEPWPIPTTSEEEDRRAAVAYFGGRTRPFKIQEIQDEFDVSAKTVQNWRRDLGLRTFVRGGTTRFPVEEVYRLLRSSIV